MLDPLYIKESILLLSKEIHFIIVTIDNVKEEQI